MKLKKNRGFTLLELLIALSVISIIGLTFYGFINNSIKINIRNEIEIKALNIAQSEIENLREQIKTKNSDSSLEIKLDNTNKIIIDTDGNENIYWSKISGSTDEEITLSSVGLYKNYIGENENGYKDYSIIKYKRNNSSYEYDINLKLTKKKIGSRYLYKINIRVSSGLNYFSKKTTTLTTEVLNK